LKKRFFPLFFILFFLCFPVFSQEENPKWQSDADLFVIESFFFNIDGITRQNALIKAGGLKTGEELKGGSALEKYIQDKTQLLYNQRVLESVSLDYSVGQINGEGKYPVNIVVNVKDTNNFFVFPDPQYNTNYGFGLALIFVHNNIFGTMSPFQTEIGYKYDEYGQSNYILSLGTGAPLRFFGINWDLLFLNEFKYRPYLEKPLYYRNAASLSAGLPLGLFTFKPGVNFSLIINDEMRINDASYGGYHYLFFGPEIEFSRIDWIGNFKNGFSISANQFYYYHFYLNKDEINPWGIFSIISAVTHLKLTGFSGVSSRLMFRHWAISSSGSYAGDVLRGILDKDVHADMMLSLNLDFPFRVFMFRPSEWFNYKKFEFFNFDLHLVPVIDTAVYRHPYIKTENIYDNVLVSGGIEAVLYPQKFRSFCFRASYGKNLKEKIDNGKYELYVGGSFFY
jgi:hypothetical protein